MCGTQKTSMHINMNREEIKEFLPHREPMLLVDETEFDGEYAHSKFHVTGEEFFVQGHFPGYPIVPGVILCEIMAQSSALLLGEGLKNKTPLYAGLDKVRFKRQVRPGDTVCVNAKVEYRRGQLFVIKGVAKVDGKVCCTAEMTFMLIDRQQD